MISNKILYGEGVEVPQVESYVIMRRLELLNERLAELLAEDYTTRNLGHVRKVEKAISFWNNFKRIQEDEI